MAGTTEVKAKLTLDSNADETLKDLKGSMKELVEETKNAGSGFKNFATTLGALAVNDMIRPALASMKELAASTIELGIHADDTKQGMAGMLAGMSGVEWETARGAADSLQEKLTHIAISTGQAKDTIEESHKALRVFLGGTSEAFDVATRNMQNLTTISNVTGIGLQELGMQFGKMSAGFVSMESPVFNLLKTAGIFSTDITKINQEWQKLTSEERIARLEGAVAGVANNLEKATPTMTDLVTSLKETGVQMMESFGGAFIKEVIDELGELRQSLNKGGEEFKDFSEALGKDFGHEAALLINDLIEAAEYFRENGHEIAEDVRDAFKFAKETIKFMVDNAGLIGGIALSAKGASMLPEGALMNFGKGAIGAEGAGGLAGKAGGAIPGLISAIVAGGPPVWAAAGAVTALGAGAAYLAYESNKEAAVKRDRLEELMRKERDRYKELRELEEDELQARKRDLQELKALAHELGDEAKSLRRFKEIGADKRATLEKNVTPFTTGIANYEAMQKEAMTNAQLLSETEAAAINDVTRGLREAVKTGDSEVSGAILSALMNNTRLRDTFLKTADVIGVGAEGLRMALDALEKQGLEGGYMHNKFSDVLKSMSTPNGMSVNFNGGQTFKIQQDFRDQDPDRVAYVFERDVAARAVSRLQASTSSPFGT